MAIGLDNVKKRKAASEAKPATLELVPAIAAPLENSVGAAAGSRPWSERGLAKEGRSIKRERWIETDFVDSLWLEWATPYVGARPYTRGLVALDRALSLEALAVGEVLERLDEYRTEVMQRLLGRHLVANIHGELEKRLLKPLRSKRTVRP